MRYALLIAILFPLLSLTACGFSPMYAKQSNGANASSAQAGFDNIDIVIIPDRDGQYLRNALIDRFYSGGTPSNPRYKLVIQPIRESIADFDITIESEATRKQITLDSTMALYDKNVKKPVLTRRLLAITSHNVLESEFSTLVTEQSAREAALNDLARQAERQLVLYFNK